MFIQRKINELEEHQFKAKSRNSSEPSECDEKAGYFEFLLSSGKLTKKLKTDDLLATVIDVLFAGVDTTSNTMQWVLYMMAKDPDKQDILRQEVLSVAWRYNIGVTDDSRTNALPESLGTGNVAALSSPLRYFPKAV